ncbi:MAG: acetate/propionate family kinase [Gemmatimonadaceae bacterium]
MGFDLRARTTVSAVSRTPRDGPSVLTINAGSSSIRFAIYRIGGVPRRLLAGSLDAMGSKHPTLSFAEPDGAMQAASPLAAGDQRATIRRLLYWLESQPAYHTVSVVGHRIVCGTNDTEPRPITATLLKELRRLASYDADHLPQQIALIDEVARRRPEVRQVACFDSAFHRTMPRVAKLLPIPRRYSAGVERYGFHGLSYAYLMEALRRIDPAAAKGRVILAHLGSGASMAAVHRGKSVDTSMGLTPTSGLVMSTRPGDLDPGLVYYLARAKHVTAARFQRMVNHESGLLGVSGTSADLRELLAREARDERAADAVALFCYQAKKWIGSFAAVLGGVETLVFAGGIGENAALIRQRICAGLGFLGIELDRRRNNRHAPLISPDVGRVAVRIIHTDEDFMIAKSAIRILVKRAR